MKLPILTRKDKRKLDNHIVTQKKLRTIGKDLSKDDIDFMVADISERSYWMLVEFLKEEGFTENRYKLKKAWVYLRKALS